MTQEFYTFLKSAQNSASFDTLHAQFRRNFLKTLIRDGAVFWKVKSSKAHHSDVNLRPLVYRPSPAPFWAAKPPLWASTALHGSILSLYSFWICSADPDPAFHSNADPDPASQNNADLYGSGSAALVPYIFTAVFHFRIHFTYSDPAPGFADPLPGIFSPIEMQCQGEGLQIRTFPKDGRIRNKVLRPPVINSKNFESSHLCLLLACCALVGVCTGRWSGLVRAGLFTWRTPDGGTLCPRNKDFHRISVPEPGCLSRIRIFPSRIQGQKYSGSASKNLSILNPKNYF